jgi:adenylate cyclase
VVAAIYTQFVEDRRTVAMAAVLIADLVGSTDLMASLGPDDLHRFLQDHFAQLQDVLDRTRGTEVKTLGDGIWAIFPSATDAVACAIAILRLVDRQADRSGPPVDIRVGVALGEVTVENGDVLGTPVVEAARLAAAARGGQILANDVVRIVSGDPSRALFRKVGDFALKGQSDPVTAYEVIWTSPLVSAVRLPTLLADIDQIILGPEVTGASDEEVHRELGGWRERDVLGG